VFKPNLHNRCIGQLILYHITPNIRLKGYQPAQQGAPRPLLVIIKIIQATFKLQAAAAASFLFQIYSSIFSYLQTCLWQELVLSKCKPVLTIQRPQKGNMDRSLSSLPLFHNGYICSGLSNSFICCITCSTFLLSHSITSQPVTSLSKLCSQCSNTVYEHDEDSYTLTLGDPIIVHVCLISPYLFVMTAKFCQALEHIKSVRSKIGSRVQDEVKNFFKLLSYNGNSRLIKEYTTWALKNKGPELYAQPRAMTGLSPEYTPGAAVC